MRGKIGLLGVPMGFAGARRGSELGVSAVRNVNLNGIDLVGALERLGYEVTDYGDVDVNSPKALPEESSNLKYLDEIADVSSKSGNAVQAILQKGQIPVILGGDHAVAIGTFSGVSSHYREIEEPIGLIWFDAHADINSPDTTPSGNIHGMPLAALLGDGNERLTNLFGFSPKVDKDRFVHIGARDVDPGERLMIQKFGVRDRFLTMSDVDRRGMVDCVLEAIEKASGGGKGKFAVTFDIDVIDPRFAPGSGTLARGGITYREAHLALEIVAESGLLASFEIVEVNPLLDERNITVELAAELVLSAMGKTII
jgi:arginase